MIFLAALAVAAELGLPYGPPVVGQARPLELAGEGTLVPTRGALEGEPVPLGDGRFRYRYLAPTTPGPDVLLWQQGSQQEPLSLEILPLPEAPAAPPVQELVVGTGPVELLFPMENPPPAGQWRIALSEGRLLEATPVAGGLKVLVQPGDGRQARLLTVALLDLRDPDQTPVLGVLRLRSRQQASVNAEPGNRVTLKVAGRSWGPFVADSSGLAQVSFEIPPGTSAYEVQVSDDLGNTQRLRSALPGPFAPVLVALEAPRIEGGADVWVAAWNATGSPWNGAPPACRVGSAEPSPTLSLRPGLFRARLPPTNPSDSRLDVRVECELEDATTSLRVPVGHDGPDHIELQVYPEVLSTDFPIADVSAALMDSRGERLPPDGLRLEARTGAVEVAPHGGTLRGEYQGAAAVPLGEDRLEAAYIAPPGEGRPWRVLVWAFEGEGTVALRARVLDRRGRPLAGQEVTVDGQKVESDARGWASARVPARPQIRVTAGAAQAVGVPMKGTEAELPDPGAPDLSAWLNLPIHAGRVRQIFLEVSPRPLVIGQQARVRVRLLDTGGAVVRGENVTLVASEGNLSTPVAAPDGSLEAMYAPAPGQGTRTVRIDAQAGGASASTDLMLMPRPVRGSVTLLGGWIGNFGVVSSPMVRLSTEGRIRSLPLEWRVGVGTWGVSGEVTATSGNVAVNAQFVSVDAGAQWVRRVGPWQLSGGIAAVLVPYSMTLSFGATPGPSGLGFSSPGLLLHAGGAWRVGASELPVELSYTLFNATGGLVSFEGSPGGLGLTAGYRILY